MPRKSAKDILKRILLSFRRNWGLKLVSLFFAIILWNYVIVAVNPTRTVTFNNIPIDQPNMSQLESAGLTIKGGYQRTVSVSVDLPRNEVQLLKPGDIHVTLNLTGIADAGKQTVRLQANSPRGSNAHANPDTIDVTVETLEKRTVPVVCEATGALPAGYWCPTPTASPQSLQISGALSDVEKIDRAVVQVPLGNLTKDFSSAEDFLLVDSTGATVSQTGLTLDPPNCIVSFAVLPMKTVPIDATNCLTGNPAQGYEVKGSPQLSASSIEIAAPADILSKIDSLPLGRVDVGGRTTDATELAPVELPQGVQAVSINSVTVTVKIGMVIVKRTVVGIPISFTGMANGLKPDKNYTGSVTFTCPELSVPGLKLASFHLVADATGKGAGTQTLTVSASYDDASAGLTDLSPDTAQITVKLVQGT
jgi:YbbR domain-containing protein